MLDDALDKLHLQAGYGSGGLKKMAENINLVENENFAALFEGAMKALGSGEWLRP